MPSHLDRLGEKRDGQTADPNALDTLRLRAEIDNEKRQLGEIKADNLRMEKSLGDSKVKAAVLAKERSGGRPLGHLCDWLGLVLMVGTIGGTAFFDWRVSLVLAGAGFCCGCLWLEAAFGESLPTRTAAAAKREGGTTP